MSLRVSPPRLAVFAGFVAVFAGLGRGSAPVKARAVELLTPVELVQDAASVPLAQKPGTVRRTRLAAIATELLPDRNALDAPGVAGGTIRLELFDDVTVVAVHTRFEPNPLGVTWVGRVERDPTSSVAIVYGADGLMTASIATAGTHYVIAPANETFRAANPIAQGRLHVVTEVDQAQFPHELEPIVVEIPEAVRRAADALPQNDTAEFIDLLVLWTPAAQSGAGGAAAIQNLINVGVAETNTSYGNSGVTQRIRLARMEAVGYTESGDHATDLNNLVTGAGTLNGVAALRNQYTADLVMLVQGSSGTGACGIARLQDPAPSAAFESQGYNVVTYDCITPNYSFAHELGHNMGLRHDWHVDDTPTPQTYAHGHVNTTVGNRWRTVMSYNNLCANQGFNCTRMLYWSNPNVQLGGAPMGVPGGTNSSCSTGSFTSNTCDAFDAQMLNNTALVVANFRQAGAPPPGSFNKTAPVNGALGIGASTTLTWQAASGATSYEYCYDTTLDSVCNGSWTSAGGSLSANIAGLATSSLYNWQVRAVNANGNTQANGGQWWTFATTGYTGAIFDSTLQAPKCGLIGIECDTGTALIRGNDTMVNGNEPNQPNTINDSCSDGTFGTFNVDESINRLRVFTVDGQPFAPGKEVTIQATTFIFSSIEDRLDLYYAPNANAPVWTLIDTVTPAGTGNQVMTRNYTLPSGTLQAIRARLRYLGAPGTCTGPANEYDDHDDLIFAVSPAAFTNFAANGDFSSGTTGWSTFATPDASYMVSNGGAGGVFQFYKRTPPAGTNQAVVFQNTGIPLANGAPIQANFHLGNSDPVNRKRMSVLLHDADFSDLSVCTYWIPPNTPLTPYQIQTHTTKPWANATISFYGATPNADGNTSVYQLDSVGLQYAPTLPSTRTLCTDPTIPGPPGGAAGPNLMLNGTFGSGLTSWALFGQINGSVNSGIFEFIRLPGNPAGVILQSNGAAMTANQRITATFQLGNSSTVRKRVTVLLHDSNFSDLSACTFWLPPGLPMSNYAYRTFATQAWANATFSVYGATVGPEQYIRLDNVTMARTPAQAMVGTECLEPGSADELGDAGTIEPAGGGRASAQAIDGPARDPDAGGIATDGFASMDDATAAAGSRVWIASADTTATRTLELAGALEVAPGRRLVFDSWLASTESRASVEVSLDGAVWETLFVVSPSDFWLPVDVDLSAYRGQTVRVRFVFDGVARGDGSPPDSWKVGLGQ